MMKQVDSTNINYSTALLSVAPHQFRIFKRYGERRAFRLERIFWSILERAAKRQEKRIGDLVFDIVRQSNDATNLSSILRCYALLWLDEEAQLRSSELQWEATLSVFNVSPSAGIILDEERRIIAYNKATLDFMQQKTGCRLAEVAEARLSFDLNVAQILEMIGDKPDKVVECGFSFRLNGSPVAGRVRLSHVATRPGELRRFLAFICPFDKA